MLRSLVVLVTLVTALVLTAPPTAAAEVREYPGRIEAVNRADVSNAVSSTIAAIHFRPGQRVAAGDVLFTLDATDFELAVETERASLLRAEAALKSAAQDYERLSKLSARGSATEVQLLKADVARAFAEAVRAETRARVRAAETDLDRTVIRAPISGIVSPAAVSLGTYVKTGRGPLATIVQLDPVRLAFEVPHAETLDMLDIKTLAFPGALLDRFLLSVRVHGDWIHPETTKPSHVSGPVDPDTGALTIWAELANPGGQLRPGLRITVLAQTLPAAGDGGN